MSKFVCQDGEPCNRCGGCWHIRENFHMEVEDDISIKEQVYRRLCVLYLYPFNRYTISLTYEEAERLKRIAAARHITLAILPKKVLYDAEQDKAIVWDWFVDHETCPFLEGTNQCTIYEHRPEICRMFPEIKNEQLFDIKKVTQWMKIAELPYEELVNRAKQALARTGIST